MIKASDITCVPDFKKTYRLMTLDQAYQYYSQALDTFETMVNIPGRMQRIPIHFSAYCDRLRQKGWAIQ